MINWFKNKKSSEQKNHEENIENVKEFLRFIPKEKGNEIQTFVGITQGLKNNIFQSGDQISLSILKFPERLEKVTEYHKDFSRSMVEIAGESKNLASHAEELDAVIHTLKDDLSSAQNLSKHTKASSMEVMNSALDSEKNIQETIQVSDSIIRDNESQYIELQRLMDLVKNIRNQIQLVREISDQTNLLSLNASIEAARAGEQGAGFAVVADGVSKLAEKSKSAVHTIEKSVNEIHNDFQKWMQGSEEKINTIKHSNSLILKTGSNIRANKSSAEESLNKMKEMESLFSDIQNMIDEIQQASERVASSSIEMSQTIDLLEEKDAQVHKEIAHIHGGIEIASKTITNQSSVWLLQFIQARRSDHIIWVGKVRECIDKKTSVGFPEIRHTHCKMGTWFYQAVVSDSKQKSIHDKLEVPHLNLHGAGAKILNAIQENNYSDIESHWEDLKKHYSDIASIFDEYEKYLEEKTLNSFIGKKQTP